MTTAHTTAVTAAMIKPDELRQRREYSPVDWHFAAMIVRHCARRDAPPDELQLLEIAAATALSCVRRSHSCLNLQQWCGQCQSASPLPDAKSWRTVLSHFPNAVCTEDNPASPPSAPMTLCGDLLYLSRFRQCERRITARLRDFLEGAPTAGTPTPAELDAIRRICRHFANADPAQNRQMQAVAKSLSSRLLALTGGPGTGKTTVMTVIMALQLAAHPEMRIALAAPTGKAAGRMREAIANELRHSLTGLEENAMRRLEALAPQTLHRLLEINPDTGVAGRNRERPLAAELVVVDECSMTSLQLFSQLMEALPANARLILIGDKNQLASVESGVVFGEICNFLSRHSPMQLCTLVENHRSGGNRNLCDFAQALVGGHGTPDFRLLANGLNQQNGVFRHLPLDGSGLFGALRKTLEACRIPIDAWRQCGSPEQAFEFCDNFKILCAIRAGKFGVVNLNLQMCDCLGMRPEEYPDGMPVMILENDADTGLNNGDIGVCFNGSIHFRGENGKLNAFAPVQLPPHECAFAMTIHKSQGSDCPNILMVLPDHDLPILTCELLYTGITRTKKQFFMIAEPADGKPLEMMLRKISHRHTERWSGLEELLEAY